MILVRFSLHIAIAHICENDLNESEKDSTRVARRIFHVVATNISHGSIDDVRTLNDVF